MNFYEQFLSEVKVEMSSDSELPKGLGLDSGYFNYKIKYAIDIEIKSWGVSNINVSAPNQQININTKLIVLDEKVNPDGDGHEVRLKINMMSCEVLIPELIQRNGFYPRYLILNLYHFKLVDDNSYECSAKGELDFNFYEK